MPGTSTQTFYHRITVHSLPDPWAHRFVFREYSGLRFDQMQRWAWFFRYVAALAQIQYPRMAVDHSWGAVVEDSMSVRIRIARMSVASRAGLLTKHLAKVDQFISQHSGLFPATEHEQWPKVEAKTNRLRSELWQAQQQLNELEAQATREQ